MILPFDHKKVNHLSSISASISIINTNLMSIFYNDRSRKLQTGHLIIAKLLELFLNCIA